VVDLLFCGRILEVVPILYDPDWAMAYDVVHVSVMESDTQLMVKVYDTMVLMVDHDVLGVSENVNVSE
jgi:hypothetical protein